jgi:hypothetical protein
MTEDKPKWDGKSRPSNDLYKKNYDEIFKKGIIGKDTTLGDVKDFLEEAEKEKKELEESYKESRRQTEERKAKEWVEGYNKWKKNK